jgi:hypothetical protein
MYSSYEDAFNQNNEELDKMAKEFLNNKNINYINAQGTYSRDNIYENTDNKISENLNDYQDGLDSISDIMTSVIKKNKCDKYDKKIIFSDDMSINSISSICNMNNHINKCKKCQKKFNNIINKRLKLLEIEKEKINNNKIINNKIINNNINNKIKEKNKLNIDEIILMLLVGIGIMIIIDVIKKFKKN